MKKTEPLLTLLSKRLSALFIAIVCATGPLPARGHRDSQVLLSQPLTIKWRYDSDQTSNLTPATDASMIYVPLTGGVLVSLSAADGKLSWKAEAGGEFSAAPVVDERCVFAASQFSDSSQGHVYGTLRALSKSTGVTLWMRTLPAPLKGGLAVSDQALFAGSVDGRVYAFDKRTGLTFWVNQYSEGFSSQPALSNDLVYFGGENGAVMALDQKSGQLSWSYRAHGAIHGPIVNGGAIYFGSSDGFVYALSELQHKLLWRWRTGAAVQSVALVDGGVLAASLDNFAYLLSRNKGSLVWRRLLPGRLSSQPVTAPDGALFTPLSSDNAIVLSLRDGKPANALALGEENSSSAAPVTANDLVLITTAHGLLAFAPPRAKTQVAAPNR